MLDGKRVKFCKMVLMVLAALAAVPGLLAADQPASSGLDAELKYMPDNCQMVFSIKVDEVLASDALKQLKKEIPEIQALETELGAEWGISLASVARLTIFAKFEEGSNPVAVVRLNKPVSAGDIKATRKVDYKENIRYQEIKAGPHNIYKEIFDHGPGGFKNAEGDVFCLVDNKSILACSEYSGRGDSPFDVLRKILERGKKPEIAQGLKNAIAKADFSKTGALAMDLKAVLAQKDSARAFKDLNKIMPGADSLLTSMEGFAGDFSLGAESRLNATLLCKDAKSADDIRKMLEGGQVVAKNMLKDVKEVPAEVKDILDAVKLSSQGASLTGSLALKTEPILKALVAMNKAQAELRKKNAEKTFKEVGEKIGGEKPKEGK